MKEWNFASLKKMLFSVVLILCLASFLILNSACSESGSFKLKDTMDLPSGGTSENFVPPSPDALYDKTAFGDTGTQRLTRNQMIDSLNLALGISPEEFRDDLPFNSPSSTYFDNDYESLSLSLNDIRSFAGFSEKLVAKLLENKSEVDELMGCTPAAANDSACLEMLLRKVGARILRRDLTDSEIQSYMDRFIPMAVSESDFYIAVELSLLALIQHPEFLYRIESEKGSQITGFQVASRLSFLVQGTGPDDQLLEAARKGELLDSEIRVSHVQRLLESDQAKKHWNRFHAQWLGFSDRVLKAGLETDMLTETQFTLSHINFESNSPWMEIFTLEKTYLSQELAQHYGIQHPGGQSTWIDYPQGRRAGVLSHGTLASLGAKFNDTSPTLRGYEVFKRLFCGEFSIDIPAGVDIDDAPGKAGDCKEDRYYMRNVSTCVECHGITDNIGFGLENLGPFGGWRQAEPNLPSCKISGEGEVESTGFQGPEQLGNLIASNPVVVSCATKQFFHFTMGRHSKPEDGETLEALVGQYYKTNTLVSLIESMARTEAIVFREN